MSIAEPSLDTLSQAISIFDTETHVHQGSKGFSGVVSDGRYLYFIPFSLGHFHGQVVRFDSESEFMQAESWQTFDLATANAGKQSFVGGVFDGRYLYLIPYFNGKHFGQVVRYDTQAEFTDPASWCSFDSEQLHENSKGFIYGTFDGRYLYLVPYQLTFEDHHGQVTRYDTQAEFTDPNSWSIFNTEQLHKDNKGFHGGIFDGRFVYLVPYSVVPVKYENSRNGRVVRYDTQADFAQTDSWSQFDTTRLHPNSKGFIGGTFDGRYAYFAPYNHGGGRFGQVTRYDTQGDFNADSSWQIFNTEQIHPDSRGFFGAIYDGKRFIYFLPHCWADNVYHGQITRYDTQGAFDDVNSWHVCDTTRVHENNKGFIGGVLMQDRYLYLAPYELFLGHHSGQVIRVDVNADIWYRA